MPETATEPVKIGALEQPASFGPYSLKVIVPVGEKPPASVAVSRTEPPITIPAEAVVEIVGEAAETTTDSLAALQAEEAPLLFGSPE